MRRRGHGTRRGRRSKSGGSTWSRTPGRTSTRRRTGSRAGRTCQAWISCGWSTSRASSSTAGTGPRRQSALPDNPFLTESAAEHLAGAGVALVGIDSLNVDSLADSRRPAHTAILDAGIPLVVHLTGLDRLPADGWRFFAVPPRIRGMGTFPVRAFALIGEVTYTER